jgi:hypothetical protein
MWGRIRDYWTEPKNAGGNVRWPCGGRTLMSIKALRNFFSFSCVRTGGGFAQRIDGEQRRCRTSRQGVTMH